MTKAIVFRYVVAAAGLATIISAGLPSLAQLNSGDPQILSTGQVITPLAPRGARFEALNPGLADNPEYTVGQAVQTVLSPDRKTLLILTSGYNSQSNANGSTNTADSNEYVFVYDVTRRDPVQKQVIQVPNTYNGIAFNPAGTEFFVAGGNNDNVHIYAPAAGKWKEETGSPVALGHLAKAVPAAGNFGGIGLEIQPEAAGLAITADGRKLVVADYENDAVSILARGDKGGWTKSAELDLRPGKSDPKATGVAGGEFPFWVAIKGNDTAFVSSIRDREVVVLEISGAPQVTGRIKLPGQPNKMVLNKAQTTLYVAQDNSDSIAVIDTATDGVLDEIKVTAPVEAYANRKNYKGAVPNNLTLSPDETRLYVTNAGENAVAVISLSKVASNSRVMGLIPTGWYPNSVVASGDGKLLYIVNGKSAAGPNPQNCTYIASDIKTHACGAANQYIWQLTKAGFQSLPVPEKDELEALTVKVLENDHFFRELTPEQSEKMAALHSKIHHVIYIIKENRTYDQVLGDLEVGNGDPDLTQFPEANTPNFHRFARKFVDLDNFFDTSDVSGDGWPWSTSARSTDVIEKEIPVNYAGRGLSNDSEGTNRNLNVGYGNTAKRYAANPLDGDDPNVLPGNANVAAPDGDDDQHGEGYLWNSALRAGRKVRNYGFFLDISRYNLPKAFAALSIPELRNPWTSNTQVAYSSNTVLRSHTDKYFRGFDQTFPDYYRYTEWKREFNYYSKAGNLPDLTLLRLPHDHFGNFGIAIDGVNTPELQIADNDFAVGLVVSTVARSPFKDDTLIFVIEDDAQDGGDHVDAHRSTAFIVGPYVKQGEVDSTRYTTVSMLRTIEDILGIPHLNLNDANALPMADAFDMKQAHWSYDAIPSDYLRQTTLPIDFDSPAPKTLAMQPLHNSKWWASQTRGMNFAVEDHLDSGKFNRVVWTGTMGNKPYPTVRSGIDLSKNRGALLDQWKRGNQQVKLTPANNGDHGKLTVKAGPGE